MDRVGRLFRSGIRIVKSVKLDEFILAWEEQVKWLIDHHPSKRVGEALLLQDIENLNKFISLAGSAIPEIPENCFPHLPFSASWHKIVLYAMKSNLID